MEIGDPATVMRIPITTGKRTTTLELASREECRELIAAVAKASLALPEDGDGQLTLMALADRPAPVIFSGGHGREGKLDPSELSDRLTAYDWSGLKSLLHFINGYCPQAVLSALEAERFAPSAPADDEWQLTPAGHGAIDQAPAPNPPHSVLENDEQVCHAQDEGYLCLAQEGHDGPDHIAYDGTDGPWHRWPITEPVTASLACGVEIQVIRDGGDDCYVCTEDDGHTGDHVAKDIYDHEVHRWPAAEPPAPVTYLACGDQLTDPASSLLAVGAISLCLLHGVTEVISAEEAATLAAPVMPV